MNQQANGSESAASDRLPSANTRFENLTPWRVALTLGVVLALGAFVVLP